jgi:alanine racemase
VSTHPTVAEIDLAAIWENFDSVKRQISPGCKILAVVKADAYGHGAVEVARLLSNDGAAVLGVAFIEEAKKIRSAGIATPILVMGGLLEEMADSVAELRLAAVATTSELLRALDQAGQRHKFVIPVHIKVDTGMGRLGTTPEDAPYLIEEALRYTGIRLEGLMTHFAEADLDNPAFAELQMDRFRSVIQHVEKQDVRIPLIHAANSAAVLRFKPPPFSMVRPGIMLYGYRPSPAFEATEPLRPSMALRTRIVQIRQMPTGTPISYGRTFVTARPSRIAVLPIGYADGYNRLLSNNGTVLIGGHPCPVVGRVCMDMTLADVTEVAGIAVGDEVVLIGSQGSRSITAEDLAVRCNSIVYEILCGIGNRVPRVYKNRPQVVRKAHKEGTS